jgi:HD-like signal output (HDOD) protein
MIEGEIQTLPVPELLRWLAHRGQDGLLVFTNSQGQQAEFCFAHGKLAAATLMGEPQTSDPEEVRAIFYLALSWRIGRLSYHDCPLPALVLRQELRLDLEQLLTEFARETELSLAQQPTAEKAEYDGGYSETFTRSDGVRMQIVDRLLRDAFTVPVMPQLAARIWELTSTEDFSLRDLSRYVMADQAVAARVLRYANSMLNTRGQEIDSLPLAVQRLGAQQVVNIVLAASLQTRQNGPDLFAARKRQLWRESVIKAFIAQPLAVYAGLNPGLGFLCGLLMDFGMNILYALIQDVLRAHPQFKPLSEDSIAKIIHDYHPRVGRVVGEKWELPQVVIEAMAQHHSLTVEETPQPYVALAALADFLGDATLKVPRAQLEASLTGYEPELLLCLPVARQLKLTPTEVAALLAALPNHLDQALAFMAD